MRAAAAVKAFILLAIAVAHPGQGAQNIGSYTQYSHPKCEQLCTDPSDFETLLPPLGPIPPPPHDDTTRAYDWSEVLLNLIKINIKKLTPPGVARILGVFSACLHDAIAQKPTLGMRPVHAIESERVSDLDLAKAVDGAAHQALVSIFGGKDAFEGTDGAPFSAMLESLAAVGASVGYSPDYYVGVRACTKVVENITTDGFSAAGNPLPGTPEPAYAPVNLPQKEAGTTDCDAEIVDLDRWQPLCVPPEDDPDGQCIPQAFSAPQADIWTTFALPAGYSLRPDGPPLLTVDQAEWERQAMEVVEFSANLSDISKVTAEHWADGPDSTAPPGHFYRVAMEAGMAKDLDLVDTVKLYFLVGSALNDAGVAAWDAKLFYDSVRPITMIQCGFKGQTLHAWKGPYQGVGDVEAGQWQPYQATFFVTPAFAGYVSGHSTFSSAAGGVLKLVFGEEYLAPKCLKVVKGDGDFEKEISDPTAEDFVDGETNVANTGPGTIGYTPGTDVVLCWDTWDSAVQEAGLSRLQGGIHIIADDIDGKSVGGPIAKLVYDKAMANWDAHRTEATYAVS